MTLKLCGFLHGSLSGTSVNGALTVKAWCVWPLCHFTSLLQLDILCYFFQVWHRLSNHLFHNSLHKPLFNFLSHFLISFDGLLAAQHGVLVCRMSFYIGAANRPFHASCNCYRRAFEMRCMLQHLWDFCPRRDTISACCDKVKWLRSNMHSSQMKLKWNKLKVSQLNRYMFGLTEDFDTCSMCTLHSC